MYVRLAFSVAAHLDPEILLVDEVLSVGDAEFQKKSLGKLNNVVEGGRTVIFVSHNHQVIRNLCDRCVWLDQGKLRLFGETNEVVDRYLQTVYPTSLQAESKMSTTSRSQVTDQLHFIRIAICDEEGSPTSILRSESSYLVEIEYKLTEHLRNFRLGVRFSTEDGVQAFLSTERDQEPTEGTNRLPGIYVSKCWIPPFLLSQRRYYITVWGAIAHQKLLAECKNELVVEVQNTTGWITKEHRNTVVNPRLPWTTERITLS
jgi:lipopolysaccharide transport system ATP-binding protein